MLDGIGTGALARSLFDLLAFVLVLIRSLLYSMASASVLALEGWCWHAFRLACWRFVLVLVCSSVDLSALVLVLAYSSHALAFARPPLCWMVLVLGLVTAYSGAGGVGPFLVLFGDGVHHTAWCWCWCWRVCWLTSCHWRWCWRHGPVRRCTR